ncbi:hypothetical protein CCP1ISM_570003 [Azospirillaceae bacterium]
MAAISMASVIAFASQAAEEAGDAMEATFSSAKSGDLKESLIFAKEAADKAIHAKKALATALRAHTSGNQDDARAALGHVEDARLFAKSAMDVARSANRRVLDGGGGPAGKKAAETMAFLMATASSLLDIKRGATVDVTIRKAALASERAGQAADDAAKAGGAANKHGEDAQAAKATAAEVARRVLWIGKEILKTRQGPAAGGGV